MFHFEHPAYYEVLSHMIELRLYAYRIDWSATCEFSSSIIEHYLVLSYLLKQPRALSSRKGKKNFPPTTPLWGYVATVVDGSLFSFSHR